MSLVNFTCANHLDNDPYNTYVIQLGLSVGIPDPDNYDGAELNFFCMPWNPSGNVRPPATLPTISTLSGSEKIFYVNNSDVTVLGSYCEIDLGEYLTFKSIGGYWYVIRKWYNLLTDIIFYKNIKKFWKQ